MKAVLSHTFASGAEMEIQRFHALRRVWVTLPLVAICTVQAFGVVPAGAAVPAGATVMDARGGRAALPLHKSTAWPLAHPAAVDPRLRMRQIVGPNAIRERQRLDALPAGHNLRFNNTAGDTIGETQSQAVVAATGDSGDKVLVVWLDSKGLSGNPHTFVGYGFSSAAGAFPTDAGSLPLLNPRVDRIGNSYMLDVDAAGNFYLAVEYETIDTSQFPQEIPTLAIAVYRGRFTGGSFNWTLPVIAVSVPSDVGAVYRPWLAVDRSNGIVYVAYERYEYPEYLTIEVIRGTHSGSTWTPPEVLEPDALDDGFARVAIGPEGNLYVVWVSGLNFGLNCDFSSTTGTVVLRRSTDAAEAMTFEPPVPVGTVNHNWTSNWAGNLLPFDFQPADIAVDRSAGPNRGNVYVIWNEAAPWTADPANGVETAESEPNDTPSAAGVETISPGGVATGSISATDDDDYWKIDVTAGQHILLRLEPEGWDCGVTSTNCNFGLWMLKGSDGDSLLAHSNAFRFASQVVFDVPETATYLFLVRNLSTSGTTTGTYKVQTRSLTYGTPSPARDMRDIVMARSSDQGMSFEPEVRVNDDATGLDNAMPGIAVDGTGEVHAFWYDSRDSRGARILRSYYHSTSQDGGVSWQPNQRVSNELMYFGSNSRLAENYGAYNQPFALGKRVYTAWSDQRLSNVWSSGVDIYYALPDSVPEVTPPVTCTHYERHLRWVGGVETPGEAHAVAVAGAYAYVADSQSGLQIVKISTPSSPTIVGSADTPGRAFGVAVAGSYAYVADESSLQIVNISVPTAPVVEGGVPTPGAAYGVAVGGSYAYVADGSAGLQVVDISDPSIPRIVGGVDTPGYATSVALGGSYAYVADGSSGFQIVDISDPKGPTLVGVGFDTPGFAFGVALSGSYAYVADGDFGLQVVDISNPQAPARVGSTPGTAVGIAVVGFHACVADGAGLRLVDITNPSAPVLQGRFGAPDFTFGIAADGSHVYLADDDFGLQIVDISHTSSTELLSRLDTPGDAWDVAAADSLACIADLGSLQVANVSRPAAPVLLGSVITPGETRSVAVADSYAYVATGLAGLAIMDLPALALVGSVDTPGYAIGVAVAGSFAYVADESGLQIVDISNRSAPVLRGRLPTPDAASGVAVIDAYAYIADSSSGLLVVDVSNPSAPALVASVDTPGNAWRVFMAGSYAYVADRTSGLQVVDISNPAAPVLVGGGTPGDAWGVVVAGSIAYVAVDHAGLQVVDVSKPALPVVLGSVDTEEAHGVAMVGSHIYVADGSFGLQVAPAQCADITAVELTDLAAEQLGSDVLLRWRTTDESDVQSFRVFRARAGKPFVPLAPDIEPSARRAYAFRDVAPEPARYIYRIGEVSPNGMVVLHGWAEVEVERYAPKVTRLHPPYPNPFNPNTTLRFDLARGGQVSLEILDVRGRILRRLLRQERRAPGEHKVTWNGRDDRGQLVASGVYQARLQVEGIISTRRLTLLK